MSENKNKKVIFDKRLDYLNEAYCLFRDIAINQSVSELKKKLAVKYNITSERILNSFDVVDQLVRLGERTFFKKEDEIKYYFYPLGVNEEYSSQMICLADFILGGRDLPIGETTDSIFNRINNWPEEDACRNIIKIIEENFDEDNTEITKEIPEKESVSCRTTLELIKYISECDFSMEEKWNIQQVILFREDHQKKLAALINEGIVFLEDTRNQWKPTLDEFCKVWEKILVEEDLSYLLTEKAGITYEDNPLGWVISPGLFFLNIFSVFNDGTPENKRPDSLRIGVLFDQDFMFLERVSDNGYMDFVCQVLKVLSDKSKFDILLYISDKKAYGSEIAQMLGLTRATISYHMNTLLNLRLVKAEQEENKIYYRGNKEIINEIMEYCKMRLT